MPTKREPAPAEKMRLTNWDSTAKYANLEVSKGNTEKEQRILDGIPKEHPEYSKIQDRINKKDKGGFFCG